MSIKMIENALIEDYQTDIEKARIISRLSDGRLGWAISCLEDDSELQIRQQILSDLDNIISFNMGDRFTYIDQLESGRRSIERKKAESLINYWLTWWRDLLLIKNNYSENVINTEFVPILDKWSHVLDTGDIVKFIENLQNSLLLISKNANIRLLLEVIMFDMPYPETNE